MPNYNIKLVFNHRGVQKQYKYKGEIHLEIAM